MARAAARGSATPALITLAITLLLAVLAFPGAGLIRRLPLLRTGMVTISAVYLLRAAVLVPTVLLKSALIDAFLVWSSLVVLAMGWRMPSAK